MRLRDPEGREKRETSGFVNMYRGVYESWEREIFGYMNKSREIDDNNYNNNNKKKKKLRYSTVHRQEPNLRMILLQS